MYVHPYVRTYIDCANAHGDSVGLLCVITRINIFIGILSLDRGLYMPI